MSVIATIYVDDREDALERSNGKKKSSGKSPIQYLDPVFDSDNRANSKKPLSNGGGVIDYKVTRLTISDYCIVLRCSGSSGTSGKGIVVAAVERKRWKDLASTITGSRAETQPRDLRLAKFKYGCYVYYFAEGSFSYTDDYKIGGGGHGQPFKALHSKLRHETIRGIPFIQTKDPEHTVQMLTKLARDFIKMRAHKEINFPLQETPSTRNALLDAYTYHIKQLGKQFAELAMKTNGANSVELVAAIGEINENLNYINTPPEDVEGGAGDDITSGNDTDLMGTFIEDLDIPELFTKQRQAGVSDIVSAMWEAIPGITRNSAPIISAEYTFLDLFGCETKEERNEMQEIISEMKFPSGTRIGKQAEKIMVNFCNEKSCDETAVLVLCAIPRVTEPAAKAITKEYSITNICDENFKVEWLQDIPVGKRKLGPALSKKIVDVFHTSTE